MHASVLIAVGALLIAWRFIDLPLTMARIQRKSASRGNAHDFDRLRRTPAFRFVPNVLLVLGAALLALGVARL